MLQGVTGKQQCIDCDVKSIDTVQYIENEGSSEVFNLVADLSAGQGNHQMARAKFFDAWVSRLQIDSQVNHTHTHDGAESNELGFMLYPKELCILNHLPASFDTVLKYESDGCNATPARVTLMTIIEGSN